MSLSAKEIIPMVEKLDKGQSVKFRLSPTFGGRIALIEVNPLFPEKRQKKYVLRLGENEEAAKKADPFWASDKAKKLAGWVGERSAELVTDVPPLKKAV
jgi:hypothetical protein